jgi:dynein intermediate chain 2, axonemal
MEVAFLYTPERKAFGHQCNFDDNKPRVMEAIPSTSVYEEEYVKRNPSILEVDTTPSYSINTCNTQRFVQKSKGMTHSEGGWPKDVDYTEQNDTTRYRRKTEKDEDYKATVKMLGPVVDRCVRQNNTIDIYEEYFAGTVVDHSSEPPSAKGLAVFRDPNNIKRTATSVNWHPDGSKIAVSYSILNFQDPRFSSERMPIKSYIWDILNPNTPEQELQPQSPLCCLRFNPKTPETLVGGSYNGLISFYDLRKSGSAPHETSVIENSHHDPVYDVFWISNKTGNLCASVSTDGQMLWWDTRRLGEPTEKIQLKTPAGTVLGGSSMAYNTEAGPTKYLVGTEQGIVLSINTRNKKQNNGITVYDEGPGKHHGPIYGIERNPLHTKFFLTIGDWTARVWVEDLKTPIMTTKYHASYLTAGSWSPTRCGVFYVTRMDGVVDIWDFFYSQNEVAYSHKVGDAALSSVSVQGTPQSGGRLVAVGDVNGTVSLLEVCDSLAVPQSNEKAAIGGMLDREQKREKNLESRAKEIARRNDQLKREKEREAQEKKDGKDDKMEEILRKVDAEFLAMIKKVEDQESSKEETKGSGSS